MAIGDVVSAEINALLTEIKGMAARFVAADAGARKDYYRKSAANVLSEANARAVMAGQQGAMAGQFQGSVGGTDVRLRPMPPQRKKDGFRGAQMNFWLYIDGDLHRDFNIHVDVVPLEKAFMSRLKQEGIVFSKRSVGKMARELREAKGWEPFAEK